MAITTSGIGSGLDVNNLVSQLMSLEQAPLTKLNAREASFQAKISAFGQIRSALGALDTATSKLASADLYVAKSSTVSDASFLTATTSTSAVSGSYSLKVLQLAQSQRVVTNATTEPSVAAGSLTIDFGSYTYDNDGVATSFSSASSVTIDLDAGSTLEQLRDAINSSGANVRASVVDNGQAKQLILAGTGEGAASAFTLTGSGGLSGFSYDATDTGGSTLSGLETAQDARLEIGGLAVTRTSNSITNVIEGVTLNLLKADPDTQLSVKVSNNNSVASTAVEAFVKAFNDVATTLKGLTRFDQETGIAATLVGDPTARNLQSQLRAVLGSAIAGFEGVNTLSALGIAFQRDGSLSFDKTKLEAAMNSPSTDVAGFFSGKEGVTGFAARFEAQLDVFLTQGSSGLLGQRVDSLKTSIDGVGNQREALARRLQVIETRYRAQFSALDSMIASMTSTSNFLSQQLSSLSTINSSR